jgi:nucleotide sugar dehydrogenase
MSTPITQLKPDQLDTAEKRAKYTVSIIGCGHTGIEQAVYFSDAGYKVTCVDTDQTVVNDISKGKTPTSKLTAETVLKNQGKKTRLNATSDIKRAVSESDIIAITVPVKVDAKKKLDYSSIQKACREIGSSLRPGSLVIVMSLTGIGTTQGLIEETLENTSGLKAGADFALSYSPNTLGPRQDSEAPSQQRRIVAATDRRGLNAASNVLRSIVGKDVQATENMKAAEVAALFEVLQHDINIAVANELATLCERLRVDCLEIRELTRTDAGDLLSRPMLANGDIQKTPYILMEDAENLNVRLRIPSAAREINEETVKHATSLVKDALRECGKPFRRSTVSLLGMSERPNRKGAASRLAKEIITTLEAKGARINLYDPYVSETEIPEIQGHFKKTLVQSLEGADCAVILMAHDQFKRLNLRKLKLIMKMPAAIVDLEETVDPEKVEKEGFIYRGLGRGIWKK